MTGSTISSTIASTVDLGSAAYPGPLTITASGAVVPPVVPPNSTGHVNGYDGVVGNAAGLSLINGGIIDGGQALRGFNATPFAAGANGGTGGIAVYLAGGGNLTNSATIVGGTGGAGGFDNYSHNAGSGGAGGVGVIFGAVGSIVNTGSIVGGTGGAGGNLGTSGTGSNFSNPGIGGAGGVGVVLTSGDQLTNSAVIMGGAGGASGTSTEGAARAGSAGGTGLVLNGGTVRNSGDLTGGVGGSGTTGYNGGNGGSGGVGGDITSGMFTNSGTGVLLGGNGGPGGAIGGVRGSGGVGGDGGDGVVITGGTFVNQGTVKGGAGAYGGSGQRGNGPQGLGGAGISINGGMVIDTGLIKAGYGYSAVDSVSFGMVAGTLEIGMGARFAGEVQANATVADVLEFGAGASIGNIGDSGFQGIIGFDHFSFASGASASAAGTVTAFDAGQTIAGFALGDTLVLDGFVANPTDATYVSGIGLELTGSSAITLDITGSGLGNHFAVSNDGFSNTTITLNPPCFAEGTCILTEQGDVAVEHLRLGDTVVLADGRTAPIIWLGHRRIDLTRHAQPEQARPILIEAGAIADGVPARDLLVSPDHALYLDKHLIPAKTLINGATIRQIAARSVTYYHVELPAHAVLYAEATPAESYLETGNRGAFEDNGGALSLHPDFAQSRREAESCARFAVDGLVVERVRSRILDRAGIATTSDPATRIRHRPDGAAVIESQSAIAGHIMPDPRDCRCLGIKIATLTIGGVSIPLDHPLLVQGWHACEPGGRWTDGAAVIPAALLAGSGSIGFTIGGTLPYPIGCVAERGGRGARA